MLYLKFSYTYTYTDIQTHNEKTVTHHSS